MVICKTIGQMVINYKYNYDYSICQVIDHPEWPSRGNFDGNSNGLIVMAIVVVDGDVC